MNQLAVYKQNSVMTQSPGRLIVMLYDGAIKFLRQAGDAMDANDMAEKGRLIVKAMAIVDDLDNSLNMEAGGEIASNLHNLYGFMRKHLFQANLKKDKEMLQHVIALLEELNEG